MPRPPNIEVRSRLLSIGQQVVHANGFNGSGVQDITGAAGIPKGSFYNYFESKDAFAADVLERYWSELEESLGPILYDARVKPLARITAYFRDLCKYHAADDFKLGCLIGNLSLELAGGSAEIRAKLLDILFRWEAMLAACLQEAQERNELPADREPAEIAATLIEGWEGAVMRSKVEQNGNACERFVEKVLPKLIS
jgi:TetR/AcrR family transcriptional repressor of nem operon